MPTTASHLNKLQVILFAVGIGCVIYATHGAPPLVSWLGLLFLGLPFLLQKDRVPKTGLTWAVALLTIWLILNILYFSPVYVPWIQYLPLYFIATFLLFSVLSTQQRYYLLAVFIGVLVASSFLAIAQVYLKVGDFAGRWPRATGLFSEHNTFATILVIGMLPLIGRYVVKPTRALLSVILLLFFALVLTQSRGGLLAFAIGMVTLLALLFISYKQLDYRRIFALLLMFVLLIIAGSISTRLLAPGSAGTVERLASVVHDQGSGRIELYKLALNLRHEAPFTGLGYGGFGFFFERDKLNYKALASQHIIFTHNDYLGLWLETGVIGLLLYLIMIAVTFFTILKVARKHSPGDQLPLIVLAAALAAYFANSTYDFPFYSLTTILLAGGMLGTLNQLACIQAEAGESRHLVYSGLSFTKYRWQLRTIFLVALLVWQGFVPLAEHHYTAYREAIARQDYPAALNNLTNAIGLLPKFHLYHTAAGSLLADMAIAKHNLKLAILADHEFEVAARLNPYVPTSLLNRALLHRDHPELFADNASRETILGWLADAHRAVPADYSLGYQYAKTCAQFGRPEEALAVIKFYREKNIISESMASSWATDFGLGEAGQRPIAPQGLTTH